MPKKKKKNRVSKDTLLKLVEAIDDLYHLNYTTFFGYEYTPPRIPEVLSLIIHKLRSRGNDEVVSLKGRGSDEGWGFYIFLVDKKIKVFENFLIYSRDFEDEESIQMLKIINNLTNLFDELESEIFEIIKLIETYIKQNV
jgi:hypothetical protein